MSNPFLGEIRMAGFNFAPRGWSFCSGQIFAIQQNTALFSLLGTQYGGNGTSNFALPNLDGRVPIHRGQGPGLSSYQIGQTGGAESVTLTTNQIPAHTHTINVSSATGTQTSPSGNYIAGVSGGMSKPNVQTFHTSAGSTLNANAVGAAGSSQPHSNLQPYLCVNFFIALQGIFPSRN